MTESAFFELLDKSFADNGLPLLDQKKKSLFCNLFSRLIEVNNSFNLTAITAPQDVIAKHFVDSLLAAAYIPANAKILDIGCGAGFPSLPLAIARPDCSVVALDSTAKKVAFVAETAKKLGISNISALCGRAEEETTRAAVGKVTLVISRAVARLNILSELALPYLSRGGLFLAMKAAQGEEELAEASRAIDFLGGGSPEIIKRHLVLADRSSEARCLILVKKEKETPAGYPRAYALIKKKPL